MIRFQINGHGVTHTTFSCTVYSENNRKLFELPRHTTKLRNIINHIHTITKHMKDECFYIRMDKAADRIRKALNEPRYGI